MKLVIATIATTLTLSAAAFADQSDARLDTLFDQLTTTTETDAANRLTEKIWEIWIQTDDSDSQEIMHQGIDAMNQRDLEKALSLYDTLTQQAPDFAEAWNKRATVHYLLGNISESAVDVKKTLELEPRHFGALSGLGLLYLASGKAEAALAAFERALEVNPHLPGPKNNIESLRNQIKRQKGDVL